MIVFIGAPNFSVFQLFYADQKQDTEKLPMKRFHSCLDLGRKNAHAEWKINEGG